MSTEENITQAFEMAKEADNQRDQARADGKMSDLPPLHGIPISIKDVFWQKGFLATAGCAFLCKESDRAEEDGVLVSLLVKAGAIPIVRGNVPQSTLSLHTDNLVFGCTRNPHDQSRSAGGSSGGDAALVAA